MIEREDGPVKHYRMVCDGCGKKTKRYAWGLDFTAKEFPGWREDKEVPPKYDDQHFCPKCAGNPEPPKVKELVPNVGDAADLSDREEAEVTLCRRAATKLEIDIGNGSKVFITAKGPIKVEQHDDLKS